jgi:hypothetical protein
MLIKKYTNTELGITCDTWIITQYTYTRPTEKEYDLKVILECFTDRESFFKGYKSLGRMSYHFKVDRDSLTLEEMYKRVKEPFMKEIPQEEGKESLFENTNFFTEAEDKIV